MSERPKWRRFEDLAATIQRDLAPQGAIVTQNERVTGVITKVARQLDIALRIPTNAGELFVVVECKDLATRVDVKEVESFIGMLEDVGANKGAMISALGFTAAAKRRAEAAAIQAWTLVDVESTDWPAYVSVPVLVEECSPYFCFTFSTHSHLIALRADEVSDLRLFASPEATAPIGTPRQLFIRWWNDGDYDVDTVENDEIELHSVPAFVKTPAGPAEVKVTARVAIERTLFFGEVSIVKLRGFAGPDMKTIRTRSLTTDWIRFADVEKTWRRLSARNEIAIRPMLEVHMSTVLADPDAA